MRPKDLLALSFLYRFFGSAIRGEGWQIYLRDYVRPKAGDRILDLGCGPADILQLMPAVDYTGVDLNADYIQSAQHRFGDRATFQCADICSFELGGSAGSFDIVLATGVLHHLDDEQAVQFMNVASSALSKNGYLVTLDGCREPQQSVVVRWLLNSDRGKFVRYRQDYERLALAKFDRVEADVRGDLLRIPYTHCIMRCHRGPS